MTNRYLHSLRMATSIVGNKFRKTQRILTYQMSINFICNLRCVYCSAPLSTKDSMELDKAKEILLNLRNQGAIQVSFLGGEPTIHPKFHEIVTYAKELGYYTTVSSNGMRTKMFATASKKILPNLVSISMDGPRKAHDPTRGKGSWEKADITLNTLAERKIPRAITAVIGKDNCTIENLVWLFEKSEKLKASLNVQFMLPELNSTDDKENRYAASEEQRNSLIKKMIQIPRKKRHRLIFGDDILQEFLTWKSLVPYYRNTKGKHCHAGMSFASVSPDYTIAPCSLTHYHRQYKGNSLYKKGFKKALKDIENIPCNDCYVGCNLLRNNVLNLNYNTLKSCLKMVWDI